MNIRKSIPIDKIYEDFCNGSSLLRLEQKYNYSRRLIVKRFKEKGFEYKSRTMKFYSGKRSITWLGFGDICGRYWGDLKLCAKKRNIDFNISIEEAWDIFNEQGGVCKLTGIKLNLIDSAVKLVKNPELQTASLDRIDSLKPYSKDNCQWVHKSINKMKNNIPQEEFIKFCSLVYLNQNK